MLPVDYCEVFRMYCIVLSGCLPCCQWTTVRCVGCIVLYCIGRMSATLHVDYCEVCRMYCIVLSGCLPRCQWTTVRCVGCIVLAGCLPRCMWTTVRCVGCIVLHCQDVCRAACGLL